MAASASGARRRRSSLVPWAVVALVAADLVSLSCSPGQIYLTGDGAGGALISSEPEPPAGAASGGRVVDVDVDEPDPGFGGGNGSGTGSGGSKETQKPPPYDPDFEVMPCSLRGDCPPKCEVDSAACLSCNAWEECRIPFPYCSGGSCVECLSGEDCRRVFGPGFSTCEEGLCGRCKVDEDCREKEFCSAGWCAECKRNYDCDFDEVCLDLRCVPAGKP